MIILLVFLMISSISLFTSKANSATAYWMASTLLGWFLTMFGFILFISKYGGFYYKINIILFLTDSIRHALLVSPFSIDTISRMITIGRSVFIFSLLGLSISIYNKPIKNIWKIYVLFLILPIVNIIFYDPIIYRYILLLIDKETTYKISFITRGWLILSFIIALSIMTYRYFEISIPWLKKNLKYIYISLFSLMVFYFYLGFLGPLQVADIRTYYFLYSDFSNFNPPLTLMQWYINIFISSVTTLLSIIFIWKYTDVESKLGKSNLQLDRKFKTANMGVRVFTHGIKNQLIMVELLINETKELYNNNQIDNKIPLNLDKSQDIIEQTLLRLDDLYKSFKNSHLQLRPISANDAIKITIDKLKITPKNIILNYSLLENDINILADMNHLTESIYNIIINAFESISSEIKGTVTIHPQIEYSWLIITIQDSGCGMDKKLINKIFDPFYTKKNTAKNWGVGLSYTTQIVKGHMGHIDVNSEVGKGSTFSIFLPIYKIY